MFTNENKQIEEYASTAIAMAGDSVVIKPDREKYSSMKITVAAARTL